MKFISTLFLLAAFCGILSAQGLPIDTIYRAQVQIRAAYVGSIVYPGLSVGLDYPLRTIKREVADAESKVLRRRYKENYVSGQLMMYYHPDLHSNWLLTAHWLGRQQLRKGLFSETRIGFGGARTFYTAPTYVVDAQGRAKRQYLAGDFYAVASFDIAIGYNLALGHDSEWAFFLRPGLFVMFPSASFLYPRPTLELGAVYRLGQYWQNRHKYVAKSRQHKPLFKFKKNKISAPTN